MRRKYMAILLVVVLLCAAGFYFTRAAEEVTPAVPQFRVGMECAYAPFNWTQMDSSHGAVPISGGIGYAAGYDVEIARRIAEGLGKELVVVKIDWNGLLPALTSGRIDAIIAGMSPLPERRESIDFTDSYYASDLVVVVQRDGPFADARTLADLYGARITAQLNTFHYSVIEQIPGVIQETAMLDFPTMIVALNAGRIDGYVSERPGAVSASVTNPNLSFIVFEDGFAYSREDVSVAVGLRQGSDLRERINQILAGISEDERNALMDAAVMQHASLE